jgi:tetratricopeptide (TPR) repeat protein
MTRLLGWAASYQEAIDTARRGLAVVGEQASADRSRLLAAGGVSHCLSGDHAQATGMLDQAVAMAEELGDQRLLGLALGYKASVHMWYMQPGPAVEAGLRAVHLLRSAGDLWELADVLWYTQYGLLFLGRHDEAAEIAQEADPLAVRLGHLVALITVRRGSGLSDLRLTGDIDRFEEFAKADLELCRGAAGYAWISFPHSFLGAAHFWRGRWDEALESFREAARLAPPGPLAGYDWAGLFLCQGYMGDRDAALASLEDRREGLPRPGRANTWGAWTMLFAVVEGLAVLGEREEAAKLYPLILEAIDSGPLVLWLSRLFQTVAGIAAAAGGQWEKAEEHYETALRQAHDLPFVIEQPEVRRWYARMLIDRHGPGDREKARELLTEAIAMYRQIGMPKHQEMAQEILNAL